MEQALQAGSWQHAVDAFNAIPASQFLGRTDATRAFAAGDGGSSDAPSLQFHVAEEALPWLPAIAKASASASASPIVLDGTIAEQAHLQRSGEVASWLQSAVLAALFLAGNYLLYRESWAGTDKEIVALFLLAFGLDLSADNVLAALKKA